MKKEKLVIAGKKYHSRLIVGTGKYRNMKECAKAVELSGAEIVTVAVRRVNIHSVALPSQKWRVAGGIRGSPIAPKLISCHHW